MNGQFGAAADGSFFSTPGWYDLVARYGTEPGWSACIYVSDDGKAGIACKTKGGSPRLESLTNLYTPDYCPLAGLKDEGALRDLVREVASQRSGISYVRLDGLDPSQKSFDAILAGFQDANFASKPFAGWGVWFEPVAHRSFSDYLAARPSVLRNTWKRKLKAAQRAAKISLRAIQPAAELEQFIASYAAVQAASWKKPEPFPRFIPQLIRYAAVCGALEAGVLEIDGKPAAAQFWIVWRGRATIFKLAYSRDRREFSPGTLLTMHMVQHVLEKRTPVEINFGRGDDEYKKLWVSMRGECWGIEAANLRTVRGVITRARMAVAAGRDVLTGRKQDRPAAR
jgi:hypothetical protein